MKTCSICRANKPLVDFGKRSRSRDGLRQECRSCTSAVNAAWKSANPDKATATQTAWYEKNAERLRAGQRLYKKTHPATHCAIQNNRRASKLQRTPAWADRAAIARVYAEAQTYREMGCEVHIDHYYPLQGELVSGLHVHQNLRVLLAADNLSKGNRLLEGRN